MGMNVFVTDGAGYIGGTAVRLLPQQGHAVTVFDNLSRGHIDSVPDDASFIEGDLDDTIRLNTGSRLPYFGLLPGAGESADASRPYEDILTSRLALHALAL